MKRYALGAVVGFIAALAIGSQMSTSPKSILADDKRESAAQLQQEIQQLKDKAPDQAHAMVSVAYHFNNLWFAANRGNWPLAEFYLNETRSHTRWAVRIIPVRKDN